jgi:hypothetical protein
MGRFSSICRLAVLLMLALTLVPATAFAQENRAKELQFPYYSDAPQSCGSGTILIGSENAEQIYNFFVGQGMQPIHAAGIMGNMKAESGLNPRRVQNTATPSGDQDNITVDGHTGYGLVQWTSRGRQQGLADLAATEGVISGDLGIQLRYVMHELQGPYKNSSYDPLLATTTVEAAVDVILQNYERPADIPGQRPVRQAFAQDFLAQFGSGDTTAGGVVSGSGGGCGLSADGCPTAPISPDQTVVVQGITVHPCIAAELDRILTLANAQGLNMSGGGYRDSAQQIETRRNNCGPTDYDIYEKPAADCEPDTAPPGESNHERGTAVDFTCNGAIISSQSDPCFIFLDENTSLQNLESEPWHWSHNGN